MQTLAVKVVPFALNVGNSKEVYFHGHIIPHLSSIPLLPRFGIVRATESFPDFLCKSLMSHMLQPFGEHALLGVPITQAVPPESPLRGCEILGINADKNYPVIEMLTEDSHRLCHGFGSRFVVGIGTHAYTIPQPFPASST